MSRRILTPFALLCMAAAVPAVPESAVSPPGQAPDPPLPMRGREWKAAPYHPPSPGTRQRKRRQQARQQGRRGGRK